MKGVADGHTHFLLLVLYTNVYGQELHFSLAVSQKVPLWQTIHLLFDKCGRYEGHSQLPFNVL